MSSISSQKDGSGFSFVDSLGGESGRRASGDLAGAMNHFTGYNQDFEGKDEGEERQHELPKLKIRNKKSRPLHRNQACITCRGRKVRSVWSPLFEDRVGLIRNVVAGAL